MMHPRVLSIQSHVVRGYVGNKSATFPLQVLGFEVDAINSVQLSNHTGYKSYKGQILNEEDLGVLTDGLFANGLNKYTHLLTGYVASSDFLRKIAVVLRDLRKENSNLIYVCDPVMGDNGKMYVPEAILPVYRDVIIPLADIITPNQYELEGKNINSIDEAWDAIETFHEKGCKHVVISSTELGSQNHLACFASSSEGSKPRKRIMVEIPKLNAQFTGTGDLFSALLLAWMHKTDKNIATSIENTLASLQAVLRRTLSKALELSGGAEPNVEQLELQLIQSKADIETPNPTIPCIHFN